MGKVSAQIHVASRFTRAALGCSCTLRESPSTSSIPSMTSKKQVGQEGQNTSLADGVVPEAALGARTTQIDVKWGTLRRSLRCHRSSHATRERVPDFSPNA